MNERRDQYKENWLRALYDYPLLMAWWTLVIYMTFVVAIVEAL